MGTVASRRTTGVAGDLLLPWPNRIANAEYRFAGREYRLEVTEPRTGSAIHGLTRTKPWRVVDASGATVTLALDLPPDAGYPFSLGMSVDVRTLGRAVWPSESPRPTEGRCACPFGAGAHPYVRLAGDGLIDDALLHLPAGRDAGGG